MNARNNYTDTTGSLARDAGVAQPTVRQYANEQLLDFVMSATGTRLFKAGQAPLVRQLYTARIARRGIPRGAQRRA